MDLDKWIKKLSPFCIQNIAYGIWTYEHDEA